MKCVFKIGMTYSRHDDKMRTLPRLDKVFTKVRAMNIKRSSLLVVFVLVLASASAQAQGSGRVAGTQCWINGKLVGGFPPGYSCPGTSGRSSGSTGSSSRSNPAVYGGFYQLGYAFGQWLVGSDSNPQAELQRRQMMEELQRRQAEAERQRQEEDARRLAEMYNRLKTNLKLSGLPDLKMKGIETGGPGLKLKLGEGDGGHAGVKGLPGVYLNDGKEPYGIPGLPGVYTGGPRDGAGMKDSGLTLKMGDQGTGAAQSAADPGMPAGAASGAESTLENADGLQVREGDDVALAAAQANLRDPGKMTPQQLADAAELFSRLPPEDQQRFMTASRDNATAGSYSPTGLKEQADASQAAARAQVPEDASAQARAGFDQPLQSTPLRLKGSDSQGRSPALPEAQPAVSTAAKANSPAASHHTTNRQQQEQVRYPSSTSRSVPQGEPARAKESNNVAPRKVQKGWQKALGCALEEVYARAESLGPAGVRFSKDLRDEMSRFIHEAGRPVSDGDDVNIADLTLDRQVSTGIGSAERQFRVEVTVHSKGNGDIDVDVQSYFTESAGKKNKQDNLQSFLVLNKFGDVIMGQKSEAVSACLAR